MSSQSTIQQQNYLITSRSFPTDPAQLEQELNKAWIDLSRVVNLKTNAIYDTAQVVTGEQWYNPNFNPNRDFRRRQSYRKVFTFGAIATGATLAINHGITGITQFTLTYGEAITDVPDYRNIPWASAILVTDQIQVTKTQTQIIIINGATAPNIVSGIFVLEYLLN